uniref:Transmembrane protein n=1 Tax=Clandestinovirus TaxID=2831644 RepID=A0A8F8KPI0_9VIRU|nr:transmembrane protein [Clandestinovirus]
MYNYGSQEWQGKAAQQETRERLERENLNRRLYGNNEGVYMPKDEVGPLAIIQMVGGLFIIPIGITIIIAGRAKHILWDTPINAMLPKNYDDNNPDHRQCKVEKAMFLIKCYVTMLLSYLGYKGVFLLTNRLLILMRTLKKR